MLQWPIFCNSFIFTGVQTTKYVEPPKDNIYLGVVLTFVVIVTGIFAYYQVSELIERS